MAFAYRSVKEIPRWPIRSNFNNLMLEPKPSLPAGRHPRASLNVLFVSSGAIQANKQDGNVLRERDAQVPAYDFFGPESHAV